MAISGENPGSKFKLLPHNSVKKPKKLGNIAEIEKILARNLNFEQFLSIFGP
jgi:hypothetical protein